MIYQIETEYITLSKGRYKKISIPILASKKIQNWKTDQKQIIFSTFSFKGNAWGIVIMPVREKIEIKNDFPQLFEFLSSMGK